MSRRYAKIFTVILVYLLAGILASCFDSIEDIPRDGGVEGIEAPEIIQVNTGDGSVTLVWGRVDKAEEYYLYRRTVQMDESRIAETAET